MDDAADYRVKCAWCGLHLAGDPQAPLVSHGICGGCLQRERERIAQVETGDAALETEG